MWIWNLLLPSGASNSQFPRSYLVLKLWTSMFFSNHNFRPLPFPLCQNLVARSFPSLAIDIPGSLVLSRLGRTRLLPWESCLPTAPSHRGGKGNHISPLSPFMKPPPSWPIHLPKVPLNTVRLCWCFNVGTEGQHKLSVHKYHPPELQRKNAFLCFTVPSLPRGHTVGPRRNACHWISPALRCTAPHSHLLGNLTHILADFSLLRPCGGLALHLPPQVSAQVSFVPQGTAFLDFWWLPCDIGFMTGWRKFMILYIIQLLFVTVGAIFFPPFYILDRIQESFWFIIFKSICL